MTEQLTAELLGAVNSMRADLTGHMHGEEKKIEDIEKRIEQLQLDLTEWRLAAERRHTNLIQSLESWTEKMDCSEAFLKTPDGKLDLIGHNRDHKERAEFGEFKAKAGREVFLNTLKILTAGAVTWVLYVLWAAFVKGPK